MSRPGTYPLGRITAITIVVELLLWAVMLVAWWVLKDQIPGFRFGRPELLKAQLIGPVMMLLFLLDLGWRNRTLKRFAHDGTRARVVPGLSGTRVFLRFLLLRLGLASVIVALAAPLHGTRVEEVKAKGIDLMVCVDVSNSMTCEDLKPSRMEVARRALSQLIDQLHGDRLGIVIFAGEAFVQLPITSDRSAAKLFLNSVNTDAVGTQGTAIGAAIDLARESFDPNTTSGKAIIVITDGENHEDDAQGAARKAAEQGIVVHTVGMGAPQGGPLPIRRNGQVTGYRKDRSNNTVISRLDESMLKEIAAAGNGLYVRATERSSGMNELLAELRTMDAQEVGTYRFASLEDQYQYPLGFGLLLMTIGLLFGERRHVRPIMELPA
jgi:Ca-activated chloride channel family protein